MTLIHIIGGSIAGITAFLCSFYYGCYLAVGVGLMIVFTTAEIDSYLETENEPNLNRKANR